MDTPATMDKRRGDTLKQQLDANSGYAADLYLRTLLQPQTLNFIKQALPKWTDSIWQRTGLDKEHRFWVRTIASVVAAGVVVKQAGILDFSVDRMTSWAIEQVQTKKAIKDGSLGHRSPISMLVSFLDQHMLDTLVVAQAFKPGPNRAQAPLLEPRRQLLIRHEINENRVFVEEQTLKKWLVKMGVNTESFYKDLKDRQILVQQRRVTLGAGTSLASGQVGVLEFHTDNPLMSGHIQLVREAVPQEAKRA